MIAAMIRNSVSVYGMGWNESPVSVHFFFSHTGESLGQMWHTESTPFCFINTDRGKAARLAEGIRFIAAVAAMT